MPFVEQKHKKLLRRLLIIVFCMGIFAYALVPLYRLICTTTGLNGKTGGPVPEAVSSAVDNTRTITLQFVATRNAQLPWKFYPMKSSVQLHPGENKRVTFFAENDSSHTMVVQAIPSVSPGDTAQYLKKTECFCFTQQTLASGQMIEMPVLFHIDKAIPRDVKVITLSYTLFDATAFADPKKKDPRAGRLN